MGEGVLVATWRQLVQDARQRPPYKPTEELFCNATSGPNIEGATQKSSHNIQLRGQTSRLNTASDMNEKAEPAVLQPPKQSKENTNVRSQRSGLLWNSHVEYCEI